MKARVYTGQTTDFRPKFLTKWSQKLLWNEILEQIQAKYSVKTHENVESIELFVFSGAELQEFIQKIEKQVYNSIACAKTKGSC